MPKPTKPTGKFQGHPYEGMPGLQVLPWRSQGQGGLRLDQGGIKTRQDYDKMVKDARKKLDEANVFLDSVIVKREVKALLDAFRSKYYPSLYIDVNIAEAPSARYGHPVYGELFIWEQYIDVKVIYNQALEEAEAKIKGG